VIKADRSGRCLKRGGGRRLFHFLQQEKGSAHELPDPASLDPESLLDEVWREELLSRALQIMERTFKNEGKAVTCRIFREFYLAEDEADYRVIAARHRLRLTDISNHLVRAKKTYLEILKGLVEETVDTPEDFCEEWQSLFGRAAE
jgi:hypothetical protein